MKGFLTLEKGSRIINIPYDNIIYISQRGRKTTFVTTRSSLEYNGRLTDIVELLDERFCRCHRSYVVNFNHVIQMYKDRIDLSNGESIYVSNGPYQRTKREYLKYLDDNGRWEVLWSLKEE